MRLDVLIPRDAAYEKELTIVGQKERLLEFSRKRIIELKKIKVPEEKTEFIRNIIKDININWDNETLDYDILINFKINKLENYLMTKEIVVNRTRVINGKAVAKILTENVTIRNIINVDENYEVQFNEASVNFKKYIDDSTLKIFRTKKK